VSLDGFLSRARPFIYIATALFSLASIAKAQDVNPQSSPDEKCPDGTARLTWSFPPNVLPSNASQFPCDNPAGCDAIPTSACLKWVDVTRSADTDLTPLAPEDPHKRKNPFLPLPPKDPPAAPSFRPTSADPTANPIGVPSIDGCKDGTGWDFEDVEYGFVDQPTVFGRHPTVEHREAVHASLQGWVGDDPIKFPNSPFIHRKNVDLDYIPAPVYGNAAPIENIRPPGWLPDIAKQIGGDYWKYSEPVNQSGDFWISSLYRRYSWGQHPGDTFDENATGTLTSPECKLSARYLIFRMGGARSSSQRIELQVYGARPLQYFGIRFPGSFGDPLLRTFGHYTQKTSIPVVTQSFPPVRAPAWTVERSATSEDQGQSDWMQTYVFDLQPFIGQRIRIRLVDDNRSECATDLDGRCLFMHPEHINADDFVFRDNPPGGVQWMKFDENRCGWSGDDRDECSPIGMVPTRPPLWGVTDVHAHPMANIGFGGHVFWGDANDPLDAVYSCDVGVPSLPVRPAIPQPQVAHACYLSADVVATVTGVALAGCDILGAAPIVGDVAAFYCRVQVTAAAAESLTQPMIHGLELHGGEKFSNGAVEMESAFFGAWQATESLLGLSDRSGPDFAFAAGLLPNFDPWKGTMAPSALTWYRDPDPTKIPDWHSLHGLNKSHNSYQVDMIRRAFEGGMRLGVWDVINSRSLAYISDAVNYSDWQALKDETDAAKRIVGSLPDVAEIAYSPADAVRIIQAGKTAVILGSEVDELGRPRPDGLAWPRSPHASGDTMQKQVDDLWELGIRKITPVHAVNNPIGGPAIFYDKYASLNHFSNGTPIEGSDFGLSESPVVRFLIPRLAGLPFDLILGDFSLFTTIGDNAGTPWNPFGWFDFDLNPPQSIYGFDAPSNAITYRVGEDGPKHKKPNPADAATDLGPTFKTDDGSSFLAPPDVLDDQILVERTVHDLDTIFAPTGGCDLLHTSDPDSAHSFYTNPIEKLLGLQSVVDKHYVAAAGHRNALGIYRSNDGYDGVAFLRAAMKKGMVLDVDHMSQQMRVDAYDLARTYGQEARTGGGWSSVAVSPNHPLPVCEAPSCDDYPFMGVHSTVRGLEKEGSGIFELRSSFGSVDEFTRTQEELAHVSQNGGTVGVFPRGSAFIPPNTSGGRCHRGSDCASWSGPFYGAGCEISTHTCNDETALLVPFPEKSTGAKTFFPPSSRDYALPQEVQNDCDISSKTFAVKYLYLSTVMGGRGLTLSTDINGFIGMLGPRYGSPNPSNTVFGNTLGREVCGGNKRDILSSAYASEVSAQQIEHSAIWYDDYVSRGAIASTVATAGGWKDPTWAPFRWREVVARSSVDQREDRAPRTAADDHVFFNTRGPELPIHHWYDQNGNRVGEQLWPMKRWGNSRAGWDFNLDGLQHIGLLPDLLQDMRNVGVQWEQLGPLFRGAQDFIDMWQRSVAIGSLHP
jgi:hypothetical protein